MAWAYSISILAFFCLIAAATSSSIFSLDIAHRPYSGPDPTRRGKRATISSTLNQISNSFYTTNITLGTPPQSIQLYLVINAADSWVNLRNSSYCADISNHCSHFGTYNPNVSSTYKFINEEFSISYKDQTGASGHYISETMNIGGKNLTGVQLAVAIETNDDMGTLGLGYSSQEVNAPNQPYPNVPQAMANAGLINSNAYSLWLNDLFASTGTILFGGVDKAKYTGDLRTISTTTQKSSDAGLLVSLTDIRFGDSVLLSNQNITVALDPGTTLSYLPDNVTSKLFPLVGAKYNSTADAVLIDCDQANNTTTVDFTLSWPVVNVTLKELVIPWRLPDGSTICYFGIGNSTDEIVLGTTFLRSAYVVYDLSNNELSIAQTIFNTTSSEIVEITNGFNGVPGAVRAPTSTSPPTTTHKSSPTSTNSPVDISGFSKSSSSSLSKGAKAGIAVGAIAGVALVSAALFLWMRHRRRTGYATGDVQTDRNSVPELVSEVTRPTKPHASVISHSTK